MFDVSRENLQGQDVVVLGPYRPWRYHKDMGGDGGNYPEHSGRILDVKEGAPRGLTYFHDFMTPKIKKAEAIAVVPSHDPAKAGHGIALLAAKIASGGTCSDASGCLIRHKRIEKLASGGDRSIQVHLNSIRVDNAHLIEGKRVLLIDDVMTTGNSLLAGRQLLLAAGAAEVLCLALGRTTY